MTASFADNEIWHVLVASDDMKRMNVDQLDDAFRLSLVDASTLVWKAGMKTWQRLGSVAGLDDEEAPPTRRAPPPPPPPRPAPPKVTAAAFAATMPNPFLAPSRAPNPFAATAPVAYASPFAQSPAPALKAPVFTPQLTAPDPYVLPKRRVAIPSEVDFRRKSGGVRFGRWLFVGLLITGGVLALYRQNLLREGARRIGLENKYLYNERRVVAFVDAKSPPAVKRVLTQLALLPGPNAIAPKPVSAPVVAPTPAPTAVAATPSEAKPTEAKPSEVKPTDDVKTVSLDALPVEAATAAAPAAEAKAPVAKAAPVAARAVTPRAKPSPKPEKAAKVAKADPKPKAEAKPKAEPKPAPPPANENPLKAAIRSAIAADAKK